MKWLCGLAVVAACSGGGATGEPSGTETSNTDPRPPPPSITTAPTNGSSEGPSSEATSVTSSGEPDVGDEPIRCYWPGGDCPPDEKCGVVPCGHDLDDQCRECVPVLGDAPAGGSCELVDAEAGWDDCAAGMYCGWVDPRTHVGTCLELCISDDDCDAGSECPSAARVGFENCDFPCDPLAPDCPENGPLCSISGGRATCGPIVPPLPGVGQPCADQCEPLALCGPSEQLACGGRTKCCSAVCDLDVEESCEAPELCVPYFVGSAPEELAHVGVCVAF